MRASQLTRPALGLLAAAMLQCPGEAYGNMGARHFFEPAASRSVLGTRSLASTIHVRRVALDLDFRLEGRRHSVAQYELVNTDPARGWNGEVAFLADADDVQVAVDGALVHTRPVTWSNPHQLTRHLGVSSPGAPSPQLQVFTLALGPTQRRRVVVTFLCNPEASGENQQRTDGRYRWGREPLGVSYGTRTFRYPLWPVFGFDGSVGQVSILVRTEDDARMAPPLQWQRRQDPKHGAAWTTTVTPTRALEEFPVPELVVSYPPASVAPLVGGSVLAAAALATSPSSLFAFDVRFAADLVFAEESAVSGGFSLGAEIDTSRTVIAMLDYQVGSTYIVSAYAGAGVLAMLSPGVAPGMEVKAGLGFSAVTLVATAQLFPYRPGAAEQLGWLRALVGAETAY